jgi:hypothetical protein
LFPYHRVKAFFTKNDGKAKKRSKIILKTKPLGEDEESAVREKNRVYENS